ncbi:SanA/YdcF family protein [Actinocorallia populi]|uniref:SanA/YdcF family protein n=1 Tax=Actinocorallia populi TaxID=2079200 RepID=UPI001E2EC95E|nr:ElyC/SanA/YdcF family protein [Actinocorallia populi]
MSPRWIPPRLRSPKLWITLAASTLAVVLAPTGWTYGTTRGHVTDLSNARAAETALVLGAGLNPAGGPSPFLAGRLDLAIELYRRGKVRAVLVSGDNSRTGYDEPTTMRDYLREHGVPEDKIVLDYAGFDTWDSCVRARRIFGADSAIVVSQDFHVARAVALCRRAGLDAQGIGDRQPHLGPTVYGYLREVPATLKAMTDVVLDRDPRFLGPREDGLDRALGG